MRQLSEVPVECKNARILLSREIARVFDEIQKAPPVTPLSVTRLPSFLTPSPASSSTASPMFLTPGSSHLSFSSPHVNNPFVTPVKYVKKRGEEGDWKEATPSSGSFQRAAAQQQPEEFVLQTKVYIPDAPTRMGGRNVKCNYVGRILGPSGMSARMIERQFGVTLLVRGAGSVRHAETEASLRGRRGYEHLAEPLHVLLVARNADKQKCLETLEKAAEKVESLLTPVHDNYKNEQLVHLAVMNGTYKERVNAKRMQTSSGNEELSKTSSTVE